MDRVNTGVAAAGACPVLAVGMPVNRLDGSPGVTPVLAAEEAGRLRSREHYSRLGLVSRRNVPDAADDPGRGVLPLAGCAARAGPGVRAGHAGREGEALAAVVPRLPEVSALGDRA